MKFNLFYFKVKQIITSMAEPIIWIRRSNIIVFSVSKDLQWTRHLNMVYAATGFPSLNPRSWVMQFIRASWHSCSIKWVSKENKIYIGIHTFLRD